MYKIAKIIGSEVIDSRGVPTVSARVVLDNGISAQAMVPSGASTGINEAQELRDGDKNRYFGKGVLNAVKNINHIISPLLYNLDCRNQCALDYLMIEKDGSPNKANLGANAILAVSLAVAKAAALSGNLPLYRYLGGINGCKLPIPMMNVINGGAHSDAPIAFQEFMLVPLNTDNFHQALRMNVEIFHALKDLLKKKNLSTAVGDEGGFAPNFTGGIKEIFDYLAMAAKNAGYIFGEDVFVSLDCAASEFYSQNQYDYRKFEGSGGKVLNSSEQINYLIKLTEKYPIFSIEDGLAESDWDSWSKLTDAIGDKTLIVGDDLFVSNSYYLKRGIAGNSANAILIKPNQIGTLSECFETIETAKKAGFTIIVSHRSGETEDTSIADIAVGCNSPFIKSGSASRSERIAKYNRLLEIEDELIG